MQIFRKIAQIFTRLSQKQDNQSINRVNFIISRRNRRSNIFFLVKASKLRATVIMTVKRNWEKFLGFLIYYRVELTYGGLSM